jgi:hypothetical protein
LKDRVGDIGNEIQPPTTPRQSHLNRPQYCQGLDKDKTPA